MPLWRVGALAIGITLLLLAAAHDVVARTIPNSLAILVAALGAALRAADGTLAAALPASMAVFAGAALCWRWRWLGGGDVKLLAAAMLLLPPSGITASLSSIAILGALLALPYIAARGRLPRPPAGHRALPLLRRAWRAERFRLARGGPLPYGAAIAAGTLLAAIKELP